MLPFHFEHKYSGNVKNFVSPEPWALYFGGAFFMKKNIYKKKKEWDEGALNCVTETFKKGNPSLVE